MMWEREKQVMKKMLYEEGKVSEFEGVDQVECNFLDVSLWFI